MESRFDFHLFQVAGAGDVLAIPCKELADITDGFDSLEIEQAADEPAVEYKCRLIRYGHGSMAGSPGMPVMVDSSGSAQSSSRSRSNWSSNGTMAWLLPNSPGVRPACRGAQTSVDSLSM
jgi:hypothetical protein